MFNIGVYCTSRYKNFPEFREYMDGCIKKYLPVGKPSALVTGDYKSTNAGNGLVARYAFENNIPLRRFATLWGKHNPSKSGKKNNAGVASNAQIIKNSNGCVLFWTPTAIAKWDFMSGGCRSFLRMCDAGHLSRPLIQIKVDIYKPFKEEDDVPQGGDSLQTVGDIPQEAPTYQSDAPQSTGISLGGGGGGGYSPSSAAPSTAVGMDVPVGAVGHNAQSSGNDISTDGMDAVGNIDSDNGNPPQTANSIISKMDIDTDGDGTNDSTVDVVDTDGNGSPDAIVNPVDTDGNGTIDALELQPINTANDIIANNQTASAPNMPQNVANTANQPQTPPQQQQNTNAETDEENK